MKSLPFTDEELEDVFTRAISNFDFGVVSTVMKVLDWTWATEEGESIMPSVSEMKDCAWELFHNALKFWKEEGGGYTDASTGGFSVSINESGEIFLSFVAEEAFAYPQAK